MSPFDIEYYLPDNTDEAIELLNELMEAGKNRCIMQEEQKL